MGGGQEAVLPETLSIKIVIVLKEELSFLCSLLWAAEIQTSVFFDL